MGVNSRLETDGINHCWITERFGGVGWCDRWTELLPQGARLNESSSSRKEVRVRGWVGRNKKVERKEGEERFVCSERSNNAWLVGKMKVASVLEKTLLIWMQEVIYSSHLEQSLLHIYCHFQLKVDNGWRVFQLTESRGTHKFQSWTSQLVARLIDRRDLKRDLQRLDIFHRCAEAIRFYITLIHPCKNPDYMLESVWLNRAALIQSFLWTAVKVLLTA